MTKPDFSTFGRIAVLMGGTSAEREVSLQSGQAVLDALRGAGADALMVDTAGNYLDELQNQAVDYAFIALHGRGGEDGRIQAVLEALGIPYTGSDVAASAVAMNKRLTKRVWQASGLPTADCHMLGGDSDWQAVLASLGGKAVLKPVLEGSSIGISIVDTAVGMERGYIEASQYDSDVMAERFIDGPEYTVSILGDQALPVIRMKAEEGFYDYAAKYEREDTHYYLPSGLSEAEESDVQALALEAFRALGCSGWGRVDLMRDGQGDWWLLEANTVPGLTSHSLVPMAAKAVGMDFTALIARLLETVPASKPAGGRP